MIDMIELTLFTWHLVGSHRAVDACFHMFVYCAQTKLWMFACLVHMFGSHVWITHSCGYLFGSHVCLFVCLVHKFVLS